MGTAENPVITANNADPGAGFTIPDCLFRETSRPCWHFGFLQHFLGGGYDLWIGAYYSADGKWVLWKAGRECLHNAGGRKRKSEEVGWRQESAAAHPQTECGALKESGACILWCSQPVAHP
jgi:hypothetical protein